MGFSQCCLSGKCGLVALEEATTIRHTTEDAGNKFRIIYQAEPEKGLVLLAEINVDPGIK